MKIQARTCLLFILLFGLTTVAFAQDDTQEDDIEADISVTFVQSGDSVEVSGEFDEYELQLRGVPGVTPAIFEVEGQIVFYQYDTLDFIESLDFVRGDVDISFTATLITNEFEMTLIVEPVRYDVSVSDVVYEIIEVVDVFEYEPGKPVETFGEYFDEIPEGVTLYLTGDRDSLTILEDAMAVRSDSLRATRTVSCVPRVSC